MMFITRQISLFQLFFVCLGGCLLGSENTRTPIVLIIIDDLGPTQIESRTTPGGDSFGKAHTPHLDAFRAEATTLDAWCNFPWCTASRVSLFSGLRPRYTGIFANSVKPVEAIPDRKFLPQILQEANYWTAGVGKVLHGGRPDSNVPGWNRFAYEYRVAINYSLRTVIWGEEYAQFGNSYALPDVRVADGAIALIDQYQASDSDKGLFLALGFWKPHGPWFCHEEDYNANTTPMLWEFGEAPTNYPPFPRLNIVAPYTEVPHRAHYYRACITHSDKNMGRVIAKLKQEGIYDKALVIVCSDHGIGMYEAGRRWAGKPAPYEPVCRVPLYIKPPNTIRPVNTPPAVVELLDLHRTILAYAGAEIPSVSEGRDLRELFNGNADNFQFARTLIYNTNHTNHLYKRVVSPGTATIIDPVRNTGYRFNRLTDPQEMVNLSQNMHHPATVAHHANWETLVEVPIEQVDEYTCKFVTERGLIYTVEVEDEGKWKQIETISGTGEEIMFGLSTREHFFARISGAQALAQNPTSFQTKFGYGIAFKGTPDATYQIQTSPDLDFWSPFREVTGKNTTNYHALILNTEFNFRVSLQPKI